MHLLRLFSAQAFLFRRRSVLLIGVFVTLFLLNFSSSVKAEVVQVVVDIPVVGEFVSEREIAVQAEALVSDTIRQEFSRNPDLSAIKVLAMASRNGEVVPVLETHVSRADWESEPVVAAWSRYYGASMTLVQRHNDDEALAIASSPAAVNLASRSVGSSPRVDRLVDLRLLEGRTAQRVLSAIN